MTLPSPRLAPPHALIRRRVIQSLGLLTAAPWLVRADPDAAVLPLPLPLHVRELVNHIGTSVADVTRSATFYSHLFQGGTLLGQEKPALRYEINFHPGALSIGPLRSGTSEGGEQTHPYIDHFCITTHPFDAAAWRARLDEEKLRHFAGGSFVVIGGISVQLLGGRAAPAPGAQHAPGAQRASGANPAASATRSARQTPPPPAAAGGFKPMPPLVTGRSIVSPHGFEHLMLHVADLDASARLFERLFGLAPHTPSPGQRLFQLADIRLALRQAPSGERPSIKAFAIRVAAFDPGRVRTALEGLGARVGPLEKSAHRTILRFADPDGIDCELWG
ncbi:MAG TPA: VOC family protein [Steroidobacteraceae bacterium]|nr:VOC family protein [Steroidobacteraceae bacterium]